MLTYTVKVGEFNTILPQYGEVLNDVTIAFVTKTFMVRKPTL
jgi:hypothetical protein